MGNYTKLAVLMAACYAAYKYSGSSVVKTAAVAIGAVTMAKNVPVVNQYI